jgi:hypothetical protein
MYPHLLNEFKKAVPEWKTSWLKNTLLVVSLLLEQKTVNLWKLKGSVGKLLGNTETDPRSHYQRLKRWLRLGARSKLLWIGMLKAAAALLEEKSKLLIVDGSSWQWGGKTYHRPAARFLTLSILYQGVSIPLWWQDLGKLGISNQGERKLLLRLALKLFRLKGKVLLGDREYIGSEWFASLQQAGVGLVIRLRSGNYQKEIEQRGRKIEKLEKKARGKVGKLVWKKFLLQGQPYYYVLKAYRSRSGKIEFLRLISTLTPALAMKNYGYRYRIETMFRHLKSNGFDLEELHVQKQYKVQMMMAALVLAYTLAVVKGLKQFRRKVAIKKHGSPEISVFRYGLDLWQNHLQSFVLFLHQLLEYFRQCLNSENSSLIKNVP